MINATYICNQPMGSVALSSPGGADGELAFSTSWDAEKEFAAKKKKNVD